MPPLIMQTAFFTFSPFFDLSFERFLRILLKFDSIGYMPYLRQILTSKPQKSSQNKRSVFAKQNVSIKYFALVFLIKLEVKFKNFSFKFYSPRPAP